MLTPVQFQVNEAWIVFRANEGFFMFVQREPYDVYVLMDAASAYVLGQILSKVTDESPNKKEVEALFKDAWALKKKWAKTLLLTEESTAMDVFKQQAQKIGSGGENQVNAG